MALDLPNVPVPLQASSTHWVALSSTAWEAGGLLTVGRKNEQSYMSMWKKQPVSDHLTRKTTHEKRQPGLAQI